jgi:ATP-dependent exoDNAse (exonuclease V) beta subunit
MANVSILDRLDPDQRAAVERRRNGAVSAGAGSGKTTAIAARYLDLVLREGADVSSILCLTFTRKAQAEMQARVWRELSSSNEPRARDQVGRFAEASISTIDSFCSSVLRGSAQDYGYPPDFRVDDRACGELAEAEALRFLLGRREDKALEELFTRMGFERAWRSLFAQAALRFATPAIRPEGDFRSMPGRAAAAREAALVRSRLALDACGAAIGAALADAPPNAPMKKAREVAAVYARLAGSEADDDGEAGDEAGDGSRLAAVQAAAALTMTGFGRSAAENEVKEAAKEGRAIAARILDLEKSRACAPLEAAVLGRLAEFAEVYRAAKRRAGIMGFHDVATSAIDLLARRKELRAYWKRRFRYIMVDEFQDDNELQKELLYLLAEDETSAADGIPAPAGLAPDKLFFVGDDKQSIYRFRGADVSVFNRLGAELGAVVTEGDAHDTVGHDDAPRLRTNYRSEPGLIAFFNELFVRVFAGAAEDYEARFEEALARGPSLGVESSVTLLWKPRGDGANAIEHGEMTERSDDASERSDDEALAEGVVAFIERSVREGSLRLPRRDAKDGEDPTRPAAYDDFAILLRSTSKQYILERFLRLHGIGYSADTVRGLFVESVANDVYAALRLALLPRDRVAYATMLRSPLVALSDDGFVAVLSRPDGDVPPPFDPACDADLSADDRARFRRGRETLQELLSRLDRGTIAGLVSWLWFEAGLRLSILRRPDTHPYLEHYDYLFALASQSDAAGESLSTFLARLEPLMGRPEKLDDLSVQREAGSGVRIMSVHRSKGLEFPVVIIPWLENAGQLDGPGEAFYHSEDAGLTLNLVPWDEPGATRANVFYDEAKLLEDAKARAETKRLFYVACTRAEAHLVFAAVEPRRADAKDASFLSLLTDGEGKPDPEGRFPALPANVEVLPLAPLTEGSYRSLLGGARSRGPGPLTAGYRGAAVLDRSYGRSVLPATALNRAAVEKAGGAAGIDGAVAVTVAVEGEGEILPPTAIDGLETTGDLFGVLCHGVLEEAIRDIGGGVEGAVTAVPAELLSVFTEPARPLAAAEALRLARGFLESDLGRRAVAFPKRESEKGIILALEGECSVACRLDLFLESEDEIWIVDFKSDRRRKSGEYDFQLAVYKAACRALAPGKKVKAFLFWLRDARAEEVETEAAPAELSRLALLAGELEAEDRGKEKA